MREKLKVLLSSEKGMRVVNILFVLSFIVPGNNILFYAPYILWMLYLAYCIKHTAYRSTKIAFTVFFLFAAAVVAANILFLMGKQF